MDYKKAFDSATLYTIILMIKIYYTPIQGHETVDISEASCIVYKTV